MYFDLASNVDLIKIYFIFYNDFCIFKDFFDFFDSCFNVSLLIFCCIIFSILRKVTLFSCFFDLTCNFFSFYYF